MSTEILTTGPRGYVAMPELPHGARVVDVGPGAYPLERADLHVDWSEEILEPIAAAGGNVLKSDINEGLPEIADKAFDYVWASHILEHVEDPAACAATLSRIGKAGTIVMPSAIKDGLFFFEEPQHKWHVLPHPQRGMPPIFIRHNPDFVEPLKDRNLQQVMQFLFRLGSDHDLTVERYMHPWFEQNESRLDVIYHWVNKLEVTVIA